MPNFNFNNSSVNGDLIQKAQKGMQFNTPVSRFGPIRPLIVLEWTPLETIGKFGEPVRFPFFINPQSISFTHEHTFSQQQTRGGWVHTHWNDKPLMIKLHGNTGLYQQDFINVLRFYAKISGKTYLELDVYQKNKNTYRDKFLSEFLTPSDSKKLLSILGSSTLPSSDNNPSNKSYGQSILQGLVSDGRLYQQAKTLGKIAFDTIEKSANIELNSTAIISLDNDLTITKDQVQNNQSTNQNLNQTGQNTLKGSSSSPTTVVPQSDFSIKGTLQTLNTVPSNQILNAGLFSSSLDSNINSNNQGIIPIFDNNILINPSGNKSLGRINSDAFLKRAFSSQENQFLQTSSDIISNFATYNMRLDNPMQLSNTNFSQIHTNLNELLSYSNILINKGNGIISGLSLEDDIRSRINTLNDFLFQFMSKITDLQDELTILQRQIKIQIKRFDSEQERKLYKKFNQKLNQALQDINTLFILKAYVDALIIEPLADAGTDTTKQAGQGASLLMSNNNTQVVLKYLEAKHPELTNGTLSSDRVSSIAQKELTNLYKGPAEGVPNLFNSDQLKTGAGNLFVAFQSQNKIPLDPANITSIPDSNQIQFGNFIRDQITQQKISSTTPLKFNTNGLNTATNASTAFAPIMDQLGVASKNIEERTKGTFGISDTPITPTYNDIVTIKLYYNGTIYEGFITHFDWQEQAGTPNIEYDMEFLVEREFLGASLSTNPTSLNINPRDIKVLTGGDGINPLAGASSLPSNVSAIVTGKVLTPGIQQSNLIGESNPEPYPATGSIPGKPANPNPGSAGNKVNIPVKNFGTPDSSSLTQDNVNNILKEGQLDLSDTN